MWALQAPLNKDARVLNSTRREFADDPVASGPGWIGSSGPCSVCVGQA